jgi:hypothetical protein
VQNDITTSVIAFILLVTLLLLALWAGRRDRGGRGE